MNRPALVEKINTLFDQNEFEQTLFYLEQLIECDGETENILDFKFYILTRLEKHQEALVSALKLEEISARKSPWHCLKIAEACLGMGKIDESLAWIEKAILERHFKRCDVFDNKPFDLIREDKRLRQLIERARENIGLEKPVQDFTVSLLGGSEFTLSSLRGQVVLIDFWDTDCPPCIKEMPTLKKLYTEFKDQGFEIIGISLDTKKSDTEKFVLENDLQWKICSTGKGFLDETADQFQIEATPSTWLIDKKGILRFYQIKGQALSDAVQLLLAEKSRELKCHGEYCTL